MYNLISIVLIATLPPGSIYLAWYVIYVVRVALTATKPDNIKFRFLWNSTVAAMVIIALLSALAIAWMTLDVNARSR